MATTQKKHKIPNMNDVLLSGFPKNWKGSRTIGGFADLVGRSRVSVYNWVRHDVIPPKSACLIVEKSTLTFDDLHPFVYGRMMPERTPVS